MVADVPNDIREMVEVAEAQSLAHLKVFLRRCVDVIRFLQLIEEEVLNQKRQMRDLLTELGPVNRLRLSEEEYSNFVEAESHDLVRLLLDKAISMEAIEDAQRAS